jgi:hypothetical protein
MSNVTAGEGTSGKLSGLRGNPRPLLTIVAVLAAAVICLHSQGRPWWCSCGQPFLWSGDAQGPHNSQHLFDPYSLTHFLHGIFFCGALAWGFPRLPPAWRLALAVAIEVMWEVFENSQFVIQRYRTATAALGYEGDTIANSLGDILSCGIGFAVARRIGLRGSIVLFLLTELVLLLWIRDDLFLSVVMLIYPVPAIKAWQMGQ